MKKHTPLTVEQQKLVENHLHLARWTVNRFIGTNEAIVGLGFDDLCQEASFALCKAAATYEDGNVQFKTYAITVIHNHLIDYCRQISAAQKRLHHRSNLTCSLVKVVPVQGQGAEEALPPNQQPVDPQVWYELQGRKVLEALVADLNSRRYNKLFLNEDSQRLGRSRSIGAHLQRDASLPSL